MYNLTLGLTRDLLGADISIKLSIKKCTFIICLLIILYFILNYFCKHCLFIFLNNNQISPIIILI